ncbi:MAG: HIT family protein [Candidatus Woesearchaeota archaeon]
MSCTYCDIINGKKKSARLYEDDKFVAFLAEQPATIGHIVVVPKEHKPIFEALSADDSEHLFNIVNRLSVSVFESIKSDGTNIIIHNGMEAGQEEPHLSVNIIPRRGDDGLMFEWPPRQLGEEEMAAVEIQLKEDLAREEESEGVRNAENSGSPATPGNTDASTAEKDADPEKVPEEEKEENYLVKQLRRMP